MAVEKDFLKSIPYFTGITDGDLDAVGRVVFEKKVERADIIVFEGDSAENLYFVVSGAAKVFKTSQSGKEQILSIVRPGDSFNDTPVFDNAPSPVSVQAMGPMVIYGISQEDLADVMKQSYQLSRNIVRVLAERVRELMDLVEDLSFRHVIGRVAKILLENAAGDNQPSPRLTQQEMAAMAGTAREVVGRSLKALEETGKIRLDRHRIVVTDRSALEGMVNQAA